MSSVDVEKDMFFRILMFFFQSINSICHLRTAYAKTMWLKHFYRYALMLQLVPKFGKF